MAAPPVSLMHWKRAESQYFTRGYAGQSTCILSIAPPVRVGNGFGKSRFTKSRFAVSLGRVPLARNHQRLVGFRSERGVETALATALATSRLWYESPIGRLQPRRYRGTGKRKLRDEKRVERPQSQGWRASAPSGGELSSRRQADDHNDIG